MPEKNDHLNEITRLMVERREPRKKFDEAEPSNDPFADAVNKGVPEPAFGDEETPGLADTPMGDELPDEEVPSEEEPKDEEEEKKISLFNTLSELIDTGRIGRTETELRSYAEEHKEEIGELMSVLDEVIDMLTVEGDIYREPETFEVPEGGEAAGKAPEKEMTPTAFAGPMSGPEGNRLESVADRILKGEKLSALLNEKVSSDERVKRWMEKNRHKFTSSDRLAREAAYRFETDYFKKVPERYTKLVKELGESARVSSQEDNPVFYETITFDSLEEQKRFKDVVAKMIDIEVDFEYTREPEIESLVLIHFARSRDEAIEKVERVLDKLGMLAPVEKAKVVDGPHKVKVYEFARGKKIDEQFDVSRAGVAVEVKFDKKEQLQQAKGALLQYKEIDGAEATEEDTLVVFTTDTDAEEARNRVLTILSQARIATMECMIQVAKPVFEVEKQTELMTKIVFDDSGTIQARGRPREVKKGESIAGIISNEDEKSLLLRHPQIRGGYRIPKSLKFHRVAVARVDEPDEIEALGQASMTLESTFEKGKSWVIVSPKDKAEVQKYYQVLRQEFDIVELYGDSGLRIGGTNRVADVKKVLHSAGLTESSVKGPRDKRKDVDLIIRAMKAHIGGPPDDPVIDDMMNIVWGPRADYQINKEGPFSLDADEQMTWEEELKWLMTEVESSDLSKAAEIARRILQSKVPSRKGEEETIGESSEKSVKEYDGPITADTDNILPVGRGISGMDGSDAGKKEYLEPFNPPAEQPPSDESGDEEPESVPVWRMDVPSDEGEMKRLGEALNKAKENNILTSWVLVQKSEGGKEVPTDAEAGAASEDNLIDGGEPSLEGGEETAPYILVEFSEDIDCEERGMFVEWLAQETADEQGEGGVLVQGYGPAEGKTIVKPSEDEEVPKEPELEEPTPEDREEEGE